jgi:hypothetical protein
MPVSSDSSHSQRIKDFAFDMPGVRLDHPGYLETIVEPRQPPTRGLQVETTWCVPVAPSSSGRPEGTNRLVAPSREAIKSAFADVRRQNRALAAPRRPPLWDGHAAERIIALLA